MQPERIGPYEVLRKLGAGGMGSVYLALDEDGKTVAVKAIHPHVAEDMTGLRRLAREVEAMKRVASPYVAELLDADLRAVRPYLVTRYVQGRSLQQLVEQRGPLAEEALRSLGAGLVAALDAIHAADVVHRDLTPRNVMMADGVPIVIDFGISQAFDATRITQTMVGTPGFVAPEVIRGEHATPMADIFSWAATMVFAATARRCFPGRTFIEVIHRTLEKEPDLTGVPRDLMPALWRSLRKEPAERPSTEALIAAFYTLSPETALPEAPRRKSSASRVAALWAAAGQAREKGEFGHAEGLYEEVRQIAVETGDTGSEMFALFQLGAAAQLRVDYGVAQEYYEEALHVARASNAAPIEALALRGLAQLAEMVGDRDRARAYSDQARQALDKRYKDGYPEPSRGADSDPFLRRWMP
ncbi:MAG TPA: serine/threonine-protein kinase [Streptosporangiaceae bacterium]|nr:serine/threonine-protein kinase [Streptosporangiaceae bacterium]